MAGRWWLKDPLPFGTLMDCGMSDYREFACSQETFDWLVETDGMRVLDDQPVLYLQVKDRLGGNLVVEAVTRRDYAPGTYAWQQAA